MMIRNGIKSTLRARGRTALFMILIFMLTVTMVLGLGMWAYCDGMLKEADRTYTSVILAEYIGAEYNDDNAADTYARAAAAEMAAMNVGDIDGVRLWEQSEKSFVSVEGYTKLNPDSPYMKDAVLYVSRFIPMTRQTYGSFKDEALLHPDCVIIDMAEQLWKIRRSGQVVRTYPMIQSDAENEYYVYENISGRQTKKPLTAQTLPDPCVVCNFTTGQYRYVSRAENMDKMIQYRKSFMIFPYDGQDEPFEFLLYDGGSYTGTYETTAYTVCVDRAVYAASDVEGKLVTLEPGDTDFAPQKGEQYLVHASELDAGSGYASYAVTGFDGDDSVPYLKVTKEEAAAETPSGDASLFYKYAERYRIANNYAEMETSCDIASLEVFHQGILHLEQGRFPEPGETGVCVVSGMMATLMDLSPGDTVCVSELVSEPSDRLSFEMTDNAAKTLTITGITNASKDYGGYVWASPDAGGFASPMFGYQLGRAVADNKKAAAVAATLEETVPDQVRVTLFDQGYASAAKPLEMMLSVARAVTFASLCGTLVVLILFAYLFVGKQKETVGIMASLGTEPGHIRLWILSGASFVLAVSVVSGAVAGGGIFRTIVQTALAAVQKMYVSDQRYSEMLVGVHLVMEETDQIPLWPAAAAGVGIFCMAVLLCVAFLVKIQRQSEAKKGSLRVRVPKSGTSVAGRGALRFALLSARRGGWRSWVVLLVSIGMSVFAGILSGSSSQREDALDTIYDSPIEGMAVSTNGRNYSGLVISAWNIRGLMDSGMTDGLYFSKGWHYWREEEMPEFGTGDSAAVRKKAWIRSQPEIIAVNDLGASAEFYHVDMPDVSWAAGQDASVFTDDRYRPVLEQLVVYDRGTEDAEPVVYPALVSRTFAQNHGLSDGDTFIVMFEAEFVNSTIKMPVELEVAGMFTPQGNKNHIYVPMAFACPVAWIADGDVTAMSGSLPSGLAVWKEETFKSVLVNSMSFETCRFSLKSAKDLDGFRSYLEDFGYSEVNNLKRNRMTIMLRDENFTETVGGIRRYLAFTSLLFPALLAVSGLLGFVVSWLMMNGRRMEFAIMRGMGAAGLRVFMSFFLEQGSLCLAGCLCGAVILMVSVGKWTACLAALGFLACYLSGCALSVLVIGRTNLMALLSERE